MLTSTIKILALVSSLQLMLPAGWCCAWDLGSCCTLAARANESAPQRHSCCRGETENPPTSGDSANNSNDPAAPSKPCQSPCCEAQPTMLARADVPVDHGLAQLADIVPLDPSAAVGMVNSPRSIHDFVSPPLHVSHCSWLC